MIKNNKGFTAFIAAIIVFFLGFIVYIKSTDTGEPKSPADSVIPAYSVTIEDSVNIVTVDEVRENIDKKDKYVFILGDDTCHACIMLKNNLRELVVEENVQLDYIDLLGEPQENVEKLLADLDYDVEGLSTPTTFIIENGEIVDTVVGAVAVEDLLDVHGDFILEDSSSEQEQGEEKTETSEEVTEEE